MARSTWDPTNLYALKDQRHSASLECAALSIGAGFPLRHDRRMAPVYVGGRMATSMRLTDNVIAAGPGDWWMFHHDAQHTGLSAFTGPAIRTEVEICHTGKLIDSSPALGADGTIYVGSDDGNLYALTPRTAP